MLADSSYDDYDKESSHLLLDDNTFSLLQYQQHRQDEEEESVASDFNRCGTDSSCLVREDMNSTGGSQGTYKSNRKLKQANLLQMWGLKKPRLHQDASFSSPDHTKMTHPKPSSTGSPNRPRVCPFYKKIPGFCCFSPFWYLSIIYTHTIHIIKNNMP